jgi:hypothetical protein
VRSFGLKRITAVEVGNYTQVLIIGNMPKSKTKIILVFIVLTVISCYHRSGKVGKDDWVKTNIFKYFIKMPTNYSIYYSKDSLRATLTNGIVKIDFLPGDYNVDGILDNRLQISQHKLNSFQKVILDSTENHISYVSLFLWDTTSATHLFQDTKYYGCSLSADGLTDEQKDTVMKILNSLSPIIKR